MRWHIIPPPRRDGNTDDEATYLALVKARERALRERVVPTLQKGSHPPAVQGSEVLEQ